MGIGLSLCLQRAQQLRVRVWRRQQTGGGETSGQSLSKIALVQAQHSACTYRGLPMTQKKQAVVVHATCTELVAAHALPARERLALPDSCMPAPYLAHAVQAASSLSLPCCAVLT